MERIELGGQWRLTQVKGKLSVPAAVPGDTHSALLAAGKIPDPYLGMDELAVQWVGREDWEFAREFEAPESMLLSDSVYLNCDSLDTFAEVYLNGQQVYTTDNMFVRWRFEVKRFLKAGRNEIRIVFRSAELAADALAKKLPYEIPASPYPFGPVHRNLVRKVQCHSGWDWGVVLMVAGIYGEIYLAATSVGRIEYVNVLQRHKHGKVALDVEVEVFSTRGGKSSLEVEIDGQIITESVTLKPGLNEVTAKVNIAKPRLWWPNGFGDQPLYPLTVRVAGDEATRRIGLRTLEVINKDDRIGKSLVFRVNGVDIFCKGANWIPCDGLPGRQTRAKYEDLLDSAVAAHMNMLRVWGGGQYESEEFYDLCDEKGLLIWQDFMFACALYPATPEFLTSVRREATHQVKRLRYRTCLAFWCGNNENLGALKWYQVSRDNRDRYLLDYNRLNEGVLADVAGKYDSEHVFWPSSPCGGVGDFSDCWRGDKRGDMHYWFVWHEGRSFDAYFEVTPRFCSEFGYQAFPSVELIKSYCPGNQLNATSPVMEHHQRHENGNSKIAEMFTRYFRLPEGFESFIYLSQVQQGLAIKMAVECWRHLRPTCMGTLYWQLNDNWPVCSWSSIEHGGKWKLLHYFAKRFYSPVIACAFQRTADKTVEVWLTNDKTQSVKGELTLEVWSFAGKVLKRLKLPAKAEAGSAALLKEYKLSDLVANPADGFLAMALRVEGETFRNEHFFCEWK